jgi:hypothetical protein
MTRRSQPPYPPELRERAVRMVAEIRDDYDSLWAAMNAVADKLGVGTGETVRKWVRQAETDSGVRPGTTAGDHGRPLHPLCAPGPRRGPCSSARPGLAGAASPPRPPATAGVDRQRAGGGSAGQDPPRCSCSVVSRVGTVS